jgi:hypothetical protein
VERQLGTALGAASILAGGGDDVASAARSFRNGLEAALKLPSLDAAGLAGGLADEWTWVAIIGRLVARAIARAAGTEPSAEGSFENLQLGPVVADVFRKLGLDEGSAWRVVSLIRMLARLPAPSSVRGLPPAERAPALARALVANESVRPYIRVNVWQGVTWFNRESFEQMLWWMLALDALDALETAPAAAAGRRHAAGVSVASRVALAAGLIARLSRAAAEAGYQLGELEDAARRR